jgi:hypothetical protein
MVVGDIDGKIAESSESAVIIGRIYHASIFATFDLFRFIFVTTLGAISHGFFSSRAQTFPSAAAAAVAAATTRVLFIDFVRSRNRDRTKAISGSNPRDAKPNFHEGVVQWHNTSSNDT